MDDFQTAMEGVEPTNVEVQLMPLLSEEEKRVLDIYDRLEELQLEVALLRAQGVLSQGEIPIFKRWFLAILKLCRYTPGRFE